MIADDELPVEVVTERMKMTKVAVWKAVSRVRRLLRDELSDLHKA